MTNKSKNWLVIGIPKNWETALSQPVPIWGLKPRYQEEFQSMNIGDLLWFYSTSPVKGVIGVGAVKDKYVDKINLVWREEFEKKEVIWPLRFRIQVLKVLPKELWKAEKIMIRDFNLFWQVGFQLLKDNQASELYKRFKNSLNIPNAKSIFSGTTVSYPLLIKEKQVAYNITQEGTKKIISHRDLQEQIAEIGKLQFYYTELEYPVELPGERKNLDVVWKREIDGVPTFTFEVEFSGMLEKAIERLRFAYQKWNSRPRIVVPEKFIRKIYNVLSVTDKDFKDEIKIYEPLQITNLLTLKRKLRTTEQNLGIY